MLQQMLPEDRDHASLSVPHGSNCLEGLNV
jgi:hypothetical protein